jgi:AraC-like DNA-binding protein
MTAFSSRTAIEDGRLRKLLQMMEEDPTSTIDDWALAFNLSHSYLSHLFKQATGASLGQVLQEQKLQRAARLLATTNLSVKEIASEIGYEHTSSFTRAFERRFEQAPRSYRRDNKSDRMG